MTWFYVNINNHVTKETKENMEYFLSIDVRVRAFENRLPLNNILVTAAPNSQKLPVWGRGKFFVYAMGLNLTSLAQKELINVGACVCLFVVTRQSQTVRWSIKSEVIVVTSIKWTPL